MEPKLLYFIENHSSKSEGFDNERRNIQSLITRELQATLYDRKGNRRDGLLGIVLPEMEQKVFHEKKHAQNVATKYQSLQLINQPL